MNLHIFGGVRVYIEKCHLTWGENAKSIHNRSNGEFNFSLQSYKSVEVDNGQFKELVLLRL